MSYPETVFIFGEERPCMFCNKLTTRGIRTVKTRLDSDAAYYYISCHERHDSRVIMMARLEGLE